MVKIHRSAKYQTMLDIVDQIQGAGIQRFSVVTMTPQEIAQASPAPWVSSGRAAGAAPS